MNIEGEDIEPEDQFIEFDNKWTSPIQHVGDSWATRFGKFIRDNFVPGYKVVKEKKE